MKFGSIPEFVAFLRTREGAVLEAQKNGLKVAGEMLVDSAKDMIGVENEGWAPLADTTVEEKQRLGYTGRISATDPLFRTGELRASISATVVQNKVVLGSDDPIAEFQEFGTDKIPPRSFIGATMHRETPEAADLIANYEMGAAMGLSGPLRPLKHREAG